MTPATADPYEIIADSWMVFRKHHPVGAYLPVGQMDGDCHECGDAWPCETVRFVLDPLLKTTVNLPVKDESKYHEGVVFGIKHPGPQQLGCPYCVATLQLPLG